MRQVLVSFAVGFIFAIGLTLSGMTMPSKVIGFLDFFGNWDPSLIFVMAGAVGVHFITYRLIMKRSTPLLDTHFQVPTRRDINPRLVGGSAIFGMGWGLGGFCPGPGMTSLLSGYAAPIIFVLSMFSGMVLFRLAEAAWKTKVSSQKASSEAVPN